MRNIFWKMLSLCGVSRQFDRVQFTNTVFTKVQFHSLYFIAPFILRPDINYKITSYFSPKVTIRMIRSLPPFMFLTMLE